jgi:hypothetical protein
MGWSKRQIIEQAFAEIGLAAYTFDLQPEQIEDALRRLDAMMAMWNGKGIRLGYPLPSSPGASDPDQQIGVPDDAIEAMTLNLALRIAPSYGKALMPETKSNASIAYKSLIMRSAMPKEMRIDPMSIPSGAGNKQWRYNQNPFLPDYAEPITVGPDSELDFN